MKVAYLLETLSNDFAKFKGSEISPVDRNGEVKLSGKFHVIR